MSRPEEERLELGLDAAADLAGEEAADRAASESWRATVEDLRLKLRADEPEARAAALAERVLAATTRRRPGWIGDLALVRDFVSYRLRESVTLRVVAASLLAHVAALPILGWYVYVERRPEPEIFFLPEPVEDFTAVDATLPAFQPPVDTLAFLDPESAGAPGRDETENARRRARFLLQGLEPPDLPPGSTEREPRTAAGRALRARALGWASDWSVAEGLALAADDRLANALLAEALLDRAVLEGERTGLRAVLALLLPVDEGAGSTGGSARHEALSRFERQVAARAIAYGYSDEDLRARWRVGLWLDGERNPWGDPFPGAGEWAATLRAALEDLGAGPSGEDPVVAAWLQWAEG